MDITNLKDLWHTVFHDDYSVISSFFDTFPMEKLVAAEYVSGRLVAAAYVIPFGELVIESRRTACAHIYAVSVLPEYRGLGLGQSVTEKAVALAESLGFGAIVLHPATKALYDFYSRHCGFYAGFSSTTCAISLNSSLENLLSPVSPREYRAMRESLLKNIPHIDLSEQILSLFQKLGGRLYVCGGGAAAVEDIDETAFFRETLGCISNFDAMTMKKKAFITAPPDALHPGNPSGMIKGIPDFDNAWMGITLE